jgi:hypothetical protein
MPSNRDSSTNFRVAVAYSQQWWLPKNISLAGTQLLVLIVGMIACDICFSRRLREKASQMFVGEDSVQVEKFSGAVLLSCVDRRIWRQSKR